MHYWYHHGKDTDIAFLSRMKAHHMRHHFRDNSVEFGVTSAYWDHVFGSVN